MDIATITLPLDEAKRAYREYRDHVRDNTEATREDKAAMLGFRALARGKALLDLHAVMAQAGCNERGLPKLAIGRPDWTWCHLERQPQTTINFQAGANACRKPERIGIPVAALPGLLRDWQDLSRHRALVPTIPPSIRPAVAQLKNYHILW